MKNMNKLKKVLKYTLLIIISIYLISSIRKFIIMKSINTKMKKIELANNYYLYTNYYYINNNSKAINKFTSEIYVKDNKIKEVTSLENNNIIIYTDTKAKKGYKFIEEDKTVEIYDNDDYNQNLTLGTLKNMQICQVSSNNLETLFYSFNPFCKIYKISDNYWFYLPNNLLKIVSSKGYPLKTHIYEDMNKLSRS